MMKRLKGLRWWIVGLICLGTIINYLARNSLAVLAPVLQTKLSFSTQEYSYVVAAFQVGYTVMQSVWLYTRFFGAETWVCFIRGSLVRSEFATRARRRLGFAGLLSRIAWTKRSRGYSGRLQGDLRMVFS